MSGHLQDEFVMNEAKNWIIRVYILKLPLINKTLISITCLNILINVIYLLELF